MYRTFTIVLKPTAEQEEQFYNYIGASRFIWNKLLELQCNRLKNKQLLLGNYDLAKVIVQLKYEPNTAWLQEISHHTLLDVARNLTLAFKYHRAGHNGFPHYKSRKISDAKFASRPDRFRITDDIIHLDKIGNITYGSRTKDVKAIVGKKVNRVTIERRGKKWVALICYACESQASVAQSGSMGIDVGVHKLVTAYCDDKVFVFESMTHNVKYVRANNRLDYLNSVLTRKLQYHVYGTPYSRRCLSYINLIKRAALRQKFRRRNNMHNIAARLLANKPVRLVMETLNVHEMQENNRTSTYVFEASLALCISIFKSACERRGIPFVQATATFPSSQLCSSCGNRQKLPLSERIYHCPKCNMTLDRDINAAKNLSNWQRTP